MVRPSTSNPITVPHHACMSASCEHTRKSDVAYCRCSSHSIHMHRSSSDLPHSAHRTPDCFVQVLVPTFSRIVIFGIPILVWSVVCELRQRVTQTFCVVGSLYVVLGVVLQMHSLHYFTTFYGPLAMLSPCHTLLTLLMVHVARKRWRVLRAIVQRKQQ